MRIMTFVTIATLSKNPLYAPKYPARQIKKASNVNMNPIKQTLIKILRIIKLCKFILVSFNSILFREKPNSLDKI